MKSKVMDTDNTIKRFNNLNYFHICGYEPDMVAADTRITKTGITKNTTTEATATATHIITITDMRTADTTIYKYGWKDIKEDVNADNNKTIITNNTHEDYFSAGSNKGRMETERNYQNKLAANTYAVFSNESNDDWNTHTPQYVEREEKPRRMRENEKATKRHTPKGEEANRYLPYKILMSNVVTKRNTQPRVETTTKGNATHRIETKRFSQKKLEPTGMQLNKVFFG